MAIDEKHILREHCTLKTGDTDVHFNIFLQCWSGTYIAQSEFLLYFALIIKIVNQ